MSSTAIRNGTAALGARRIALCGVATWVLAVFAAPAAAATDPGTHIDNVASLRFTVGGTDQTVSSNPVSLVVDERLDLTLVRTGTGPVARDPKTTVAAVLTNTGSGHEAFTVAASIAGAIVAVDGDGNGQYDPAHDTLLTGGQTAMLAPGASVAIVVVADTSAAGAAALSVGAKAVTASGAAGTVAAGAGDGGSDAVVGGTGAAAAFSVGILDGAAAPTLTKSQAIMAPDGSSRPVSGARVTYTLDAAFSAASTGVRLADPIPAGTRYVAGSLTLDGAALSDAADSDAGQADATGIAVALGTVPSAAVHRVQFQVQIQ